MKKIVLLLVLCCPLWVNAQVEKDSLVSYKMYQQLQKKVDSLLNIIQNTKQVEKPKVKITNRKIVLYRLMFTIGEDLQNENLFRGVKIVDRKEVKIGKKDIQKLMENLVLNDKPAYKVKCPLMPKYGVSLEVNGEQQDYLISFSCGNIERFTSEGKTQIAVKDIEILQSFLETILKH